MGRTRGSWGATRRRSRWVLGTVLAVVVAMSGGARQASAATPPPTFVQQTSGRASAASLTLTPPQVVTTGDRLIVQVGIWSSANATARSVADSAGNTWTRLSSTVASDHTELSTWTAPVATGAGTRPTITVTATGTADIGGSVLDYSGVSTATGIAVLDVSKTAIGSTGSASATVATGATTATTAGPELAVGVYADSGFGDTLTPGTGWTSRVNVSPTGDMEFMAEDQVVNAGATPSATFGTGARTPWLAAVLVLRSASTAPTVPAAPTAVTATAADHSATVSWTAPSNGGSPVTSYAVTPYAAGVAQTPVVVTGTPPSPTATASGLTDGVSYTFTVTATNAVGTSAASVASNPVVPGPVTQGQWGSVQTWPIVAVHSVLLNTGKLVVWDGWETPEPTSVYDPATGSFTTVVAPSSIFCAGQVQLPDGRILVVGGYGVSTTGNLGLADTNIFDPATNTWTRVANMNLPRWYPDLTELADGRYVAISGSSSSASTWADTPEVYDPASNTWTLLSGISTSQVHEEEYPFSYLLPNGKVFTMGPSEDLSFLLDVGAKTWTPVGGTSGVVNGSSVMYRPGKILYSGGAPSVTSTTTATASTSIIDLTAATPTWQHVAPMKTARVYHTLTMLADGRVLAIGGEPTSDQTAVTSGVLTTEIWDPATQTWTNDAPISAARNYHSTAVLLPDGRVMVAGGGHEENLSGPGQYSAQFYSPSYLSNGPRPTISSAPAGATYGSSFTLGTPDASSISAVNLVSLGADTHQSDMSQHFVPLSFTAGSGSLSVQAPSAAAMAPPGYYMVFVVNGNGVPSVASIVRLSSALTAPLAPAAPTATPGDSSAQVSWTAPDNGGSPITSYMVTPYLSGQAQPVVTVTGSPAPLSTKITGLVNGSSYTFTVAATNAVGTGPASAQSNAVTPRAGASPPVFVQQTSNRASATSLVLTPPQAVTAGDRLIVQVGIWSSGNATAQSVADSAGNSWTRLTSTVASDHTELSTWSAPITAGGGTRPIVTVTATGSADIGASLLDYTGVSTVTGTGVVDVSRTATGSTGSAAATVATGATTATTTGPELAVGLYTDSGFGDTLTPGTGWTSRVNVSPTGDMEFMAEDQVVNAGAIPSATFGTGARTPWLTAILVLKGG